MTEEEELARLTQRIEAARAGAPSVDPPPAPVALLSSARNPWCSGWSWVLVAVPGALNAWERGGSIRWVPPLVVLLLAGTRIGRSVRYGAKPWRVHP